MTVRKLEPVLLWPDGAPGALGEGPEDQPRLTPYLPAGEGPRAAVVVCPGGGYNVRAPHEGEPIARWLAGLGVAAFVLDYRVRPYRHPVPLTDAQRAIRRVRAEAQSWGLDGRVGILGFSAGGHLAATAATWFDEGAPDAPDPLDRPSCRPDLAVLCYAVTSFTDHCHGGSANTLLGPDAPADLRAALSLHTRVTSRTPPTFLWHTADDAVVPVQNSLMFADALAGAGVSFALHVFPHGRHGLGLAEGDPVVGQWPALCGAWLGEMGFRP